MIFFRARIFAVRVLCAVCVLSAAAAAAQTSAPAPEEIDIDVSEELDSGFIASPEERAEHYIKNEEFGKLLGHAKKWTKNYPGDDGGWHYLGRALREAGDIGGSADAFNRAWELSDKRDYRIKESIGDIYFQIKEWEKAEGAYRAAAALREDRAVLWEKITDSVLLARASGWQLAAARALKKMLTFGAYVNDGKRWRQYAELLDALGSDAENLYRAYRHVVRLTVRDIAAWERLYDIETARKNDSEAEKIVRILYRLNSENPVANMHYGMQLLRAHPKTAQEHLKTALASGEKLSEKRRAQIYIILGGLEKSSAAALAHYRNAIKHDPANIAAWDEAITRLRSLGQRKKAQKAYERLLAVERKLKRNEKIVAADADVLLN